MAEAVAALSLAANILQVLDYGREFVVAAYNIWESGQQGVEEFVALQTLCRDLDDASRSLHSQEIARLSSSSASVGDKAIANLAEECAKLAQRMLNALHQVGVPGHGRKRDAAKAAFKLLWTKDEVKALDTQLGDFRSQLTFRLLISLRSYATQSVENQGHIIEQLNKSQQDTKYLHQKMDQLLLTADQGLGSSAIDYVVNRSRSRALGDSNLGESLQAALFSGISANVNWVDDTCTSHLVVESSRKRKLEAAFLSALQYDGMIEREASVTEAHQATFRWIFLEDSSRPVKWTNFVSWLQSPDQLYWVTGKAGSGKSTLMKFVTQPPPLEPERKGPEQPEPRCMEYLRRWAGDRPLIVASFYFWAAGSKMQTTRAALYRTLLHQLLSTRSDLLPIVSPTRWEALCLFDQDRRPFQEDELRDTLRRTLSEAASTAAVCLFIDGLDEFDGKHDDLIILLKHLVENTPVKMCVASRPWEVFQDAFQNKPSLRLEDLTYQDIKDFVTSRFQSSASFAQLGSREPEFASQLVEEVVQKASGVFLWVHLVVSSLLDGMKFGDRIIDLQCRLDSLPSDLEDLYGRIISDLDPFYFEHAAQYFQIMHASVEPPSALLLSFADEPCPDFALKLPLQKLSQEDMLIRVETMRRRVNSRCKGLIEVAGFNLEVLEFKEARGILVQYLHKTVMDYLGKPTVREMLLKRMDSTFDPYLSLCAGTLAMFKVAIENRDPRDFTRCLKYGSRVSKQRVPEMMTLLDDAEKVFPVDLGMRKRIFEEATGDELQIPEAIDLPRQTVSFLSLVVLCGVMEYIRRRAPDKCLVDLDDETLDPSNRNTVSWDGIKRFARNMTSRRRNQSSRQWPLLFDALPLTRSDATTRSMIATLLDKGADPNHLIPGSPYRVDVTVWGYTLMNLLWLAKRSPYPENKELWEDIARLMLAHGGRIDRRFVGSTVTVLLYDTVAQLRQLQGVELKNFKTMVKQGLREMKDKGAGLNFPMAYDIV
ncbi:hypothetical protein B0H66DRAFT_144100 [Apodospora peruviana]|uniref:NACHT domain-containing protein n=1 Tax=Apodospora peruviana TaxID=516989 RepID=A0AAE0IIQ4_9PEZI|nr:hypothetical protein B0H66DRAFT_144100 [Apodospora peruviana]